MDAPQIQYARTEDGVNIAYSTYGSGPPIVKIPRVHMPPFQTFWRDPGVRAALWETLGRGQTYVAYDERGVGLSSDYQGPVSFETMQADCRAVIEALGPEPVMLWGASTGSLVASAIAAALPEKVSHLVEWLPLATGEQFWRPMQGIYALLDQDYRLFTDTLWKATAQWDSVEAVQRFVDDVVRDLPEATLRARVAAIRPADVSESLPLIQCPTLLFQPSGGAVTDLLATAAQEMAQRIPHVQIVFSDQFGLTTEFFLPIREAIDAFVASSQPEPEAPAGAGSQSAFRTILFTDVEASTALTQKLGDDKAQEVLHGHNDVVRTALTDNGGEEVKHTGDGIMASFPSAVSAVQAALQIQRDLASAEIRVRIGLNAGEPIAEDHDYFGTAVQLAARICDRAEPGQVLVSDVVRQLCAGKTFTFEDVGAATLKGFDEPVALYAVGVE